MPTENRLNSSGRGFAIQARPEPSFATWRRGYHDIKGIVLLAVVVNEAGCAMEVKVLRSSGDAELDSGGGGDGDPVDFPAGDSGGRTVTARVEVPVRFRLK